MNEKHTSPYLSKIGTLVQAITHVRLRCMVRLRSHKSINSNHQSLAIRELIALVLVTVDEYIILLQLKILLLLVHK